MKGYVYILTNPSMPGVFKIGRSKNGGRARAVDLYTTGVPTCFDVLTEILVEDCVLTESFIHESLGEFRVNASREFFRCDPEQAVEALFSAALSDWDMAAVEADFADLSSQHRVADWADCHPVEVQEVMLYVAPEHWREAAAKYIERRKSRLQEYQEASEQATSNTLHVVGSDKA